MDNNLKQLDEFITANAKKSFAKTSKSEDNITKKSEDSKEKEQPIQENPTTNDSDNSKIEVLPDEINQSKEGEEKIEDNEPELPENSNQKVRQAFALLKRRMKAIKEKLPSEEDLKLLEQFKSKKDVYEVGEKLYAKTVGWQDHPEVLVEDVKRAFPKAYELLKQEILGQVQQKQDIKSPESLQSNDVLSSLEQEIKKLQQDIETGDGIDASALNGVMSKMYEVLKTKSLQTEPIDVEDKIQKLLEEKLRTVREEEERKQKEIVENIRKQKIHSLQTKWLSAKEEVQKELSLTPEQSSFLHDAVIKTANAKFGKQIQSPTPDFSEAENFDYAKTFKDMAVQLKLVNSSPSPKTDGLPVLPKDSVVQGKPKAELKDAKSILDYFSNKYLN